MVDFNRFENGNNKDYHFEKYDGQMDLNSNNKKTQSMFNKILSVFDENKNNKLDGNEIRTIWNNIIAADENQDGTITEKEVEKVIKNNSILSKLKMSAKELLNCITIIDKNIDESFEKTKAEVHERIMADIQKKYPSDKYDIKVTENNKDVSEITINAKENNFTISIRIYEDGKYDVYTTQDNNHTIECYDKNGQLDHYGKLNNKTHMWENGDSITDAIYGEITAKTKLGLPTTGENIEKYIQQVTPQNISIILRNYQAKDGQTLLDAINGEWGLDDKVKQRILNHLNKCCIESDFWKYNGPNTKIDDDLYQGRVGDCWFLATIAAIRRSPKGQQILDGMITNNKDGTYTVKFKGSDETYTVSALELMAKKDYSDGDLDVRILEIAAEKHYNILGIKHGGNPCFAYNLLLGANDKWKNFLRNFAPKPEPKKIKELLNNPNIIMTANINPFSKLWGLIVKDIPKDSEYKEDVATAHGYAVYDIDDNNIYLKNPWNTEKNVAIPLDVFEEYWGCVQWTEIT